MLYKFIFLKTIIPDYDVSVYSCFACPPFGWLAFYGLLVFVWFKRRKIHSISQLECSSLYMICAFFYFWVIKSYTNASYTNNRSANQQYIKIHTKMAMFARWNVTAVNGYSNNALMLRFRWSRNCRKNTKADRAEKAWSSCMKFSFLLTTGLWFRFKNMRFTCKLFYN